MTWYEWIWASIAVILFAAFFIIILCLSLMNSQSGDFIGALLGFFIGVPLAAIVSVTWPLWFPFTFILDVRESLQKKNK